MAKKRKVGKPTQYRPSYVKVAIELCQGGATETELAEELDVSTVTLWRWKAKYPEFRNAVAAGREVADNIVERTLFQRAIGYTYDTQKIFMPSGSSEPVSVPVREHVPADPGLLRFWLMNRRPEQWKDKRDVNLTGSVSSTKTSEELQQEFLAFIESMGLTVDQVIEKLAPPLMIEGIANRDDEDNEDDE